MASVMKFTHEAVVNLIRHNGRNIEGNSNADINPELTHLNYSFSMKEHGELSDYQYYKKLVDSSYIYGRGTLREKDAIKACSWVVTAPADIVGDKDKEDAFFRGVYSFISNRYGSENIINNVVHYDEAGEPHCHVIFVPIVELDHEKIKHKTIRDKTAVQASSGRWYFDSHYKLDDGQKVPLKNYSKMSDYYDKKISANDVLNKAELKHFHTDLQSYLIENNIEGKVVNGTTGGISFSIQKLKEFTAKTGLKISDLKSHIKDASLIESYINHAPQLAEKDIINLTVEEKLQRIEHEIGDTKTRIELEYQISEKDKTISELKETIKQLKVELDRAHSQIKEHEIAEKEQNNKNRGWGHEHESSWGRSRDESERTW
ncbi:Plasmid recombination enzyme [Pseudobutyrivibrio ruminis]|uniref:Plasmid recombination enzyme n=1 Tax=Pseudobutyrivibrio ruminis TaxID=46206 RepID=A0A1H7F3F2_9FIRM|nr:plasmid recombination protein [Pseudobutyrivibrio ruminis]SEK18540.1 Plasmid recombination enzyme [Pseudobutyrivibrio ruminis]